MFGSGSATYYGTGVSSGDGGRKGRPSFGTDDYFSSTQLGPPSRWPTVEEPRQRRLSNAAQPSSRRQTSLEPPCLPATICLLHRSRDAESGAIKLYGKEMGAVSLVGWPHRKGAQIVPGEAEFWMSDGTGTVLVRMDIRLDAETTLLKTLRDLVLPNSDPSTSTASTGDGQSKDGSIKDGSIKDGSIEERTEGLSDEAEEEAGSKTESTEAKQDEPNNLKDEKPKEKQSPPMLNYIRVVGTLSTELEEGSIVVRAIHIRKADPSEAAFFHSLWCVWIGTSDPSVPFQHHSSGESQSLEQDRGSAPFSSAEGYSPPIPTDCDSVVLPPIFSSIQSNRWGLAIAKYIMRYRTPPLGIAVEQIQPAMAAMGLGDVTEVELALAQLKDADLLDETEPGYVDLIFE